jgi:hypothetical protein
VNTFDNAHTRFATSMAISNAIDRFACSTCNANPSSASARRSNGPTCPAANPCALTTNTSKASPASSPTIARTAERYPANRSADTTTSPATPASCAAFTLAATTSKPGASCPAKNTHHGFCSGSKEMFTRRHRAQLSLRQRL